VMQARRAELVAERANAVAARPRAEPRPIAVEPKVAPISLAVGSPLKEPKR